MFAIHSNLLSCYDAQVWEASKTLKFNGQHTRVCRSALRRNKQTAISCIFQPWTVSADLPVRPYATPTTSTNDKVWQPVLYVAWEAKLRAETDIKTLLTDSEHIKHVLPSPADITSIPTPWMLRAASKRTTPALFTSKHHQNSDSSHVELTTKRPLKKAALNARAHSAHINLVIGALLMAPFHYAKNNLLILSLASPLLSRRVFPLRSHWQLYLLMRSDFIKEAPSQPSPGLLTQMLQLAAVDGSRLELFGAEGRREGEKAGGSDPNEAGVLWKACVEWICSFVCETCVKLHVSSAVLTVCAQTC